MNETGGAKDFNYFEKEKRMTAQGRLECEIDDLIRLYLAKRSDVLQVSIEDLVNQMTEIKSNLKGKWNDDLGTGMELMEVMLLGYLAGTLQKYVSGDTTGKEKKQHDENCLLNGVI